MGEKVVITREQGKAVEKLKGIHKNYSDEYRNLQLIQEKLNGDYQEEDDEIKEVNGIPNRDFIKLLHYGYEVEEPYKIGDWVVTKLDGKTKKITGVKDFHAIDGDACFDLDDSVLVFQSQIRHATESEIAKEKERRKWGRVYREAEEYKIGDIVKIEGRGFQGRGFHGINYVNDLGGIKVRYLLKMFDKDECELICFVEDRKDEGYYQ